MINLKSYLPSFLSDNKTFTEIFNSEEQEFNSLGNKIEEVKAQLNVDTATWALDIYEKELGIATDYTKDLNYRRSIIKSRWRGTGKLDSTLIKIVCNAFTNGNVEVTFDGSINIKFNSIIGIPPNLNDLKNSLEQIKPAYLAIKYLFAYLLIKDIDNVMTIGQLENITLDKFAGGEIIG